MLENDREKLAAGIAAAKRIIDPQGNLSIERSPEAQLRCSRIFMAEETPVPPLGGASAMRTTVFASRI
jgi:hypothetical protein